MTQGGTKSSEGRAENWEDYFQALKLNEGTPNIFAAGFQNCYLLWTFFFYTYSLGLLTGVSTVVILALAHYCMLGMLGSNNSSLGVEWVDYIVRCSYICVYNLYFHKSIGGKKLYPSDFTYIQELHSYWDLIQNLQSWCYIRMNLLETLEGSWMYFTCGSTWIIGGQWEYCSGQILRWPSYDSHLLVITPLFNSLPFSVGRTCDLFQTNRRW